MLKLWLQPPGEQPVLKFSFFFLPDVGVVDGRGWEGEGGG
jgi:hypothetical protein